jgi:DNA-binding NarL/FixJ family response regulator
MAEGVAAKVIADILGLNQRTIRKYAAAGIMVRVGHGRYALR